MNDVSRLRQAVEAGNGQAIAQLLPLVYEELRKLAAARLAHEKADHTLQPTALVHEAYLRLLGTQDFQNRKHFFAAAAEAMRRILIDHAREKHALKRGGQRELVSLDEVVFAAPKQLDDLLDLDEALRDLEQHDAMAAQLVKLRFFAGMTLKEVASTLDLAPRSADALWAYARAWLLDRLAEPATDDVDKT